MLNDASIMPIGQYKGKPLSEVPDGHLQWIWKNYKRTPNLKELFDYIEDNLDAIEANVSHEKSNRNQEPYVYK